MNTSNNPYRGQDFFKLWVEICKEREEVHLRDFRNSRLHTGHMLTKENSVIEAVANQLDLKCYCGYYSIDAILFKDPDDRVPDVPPNTTWVRRIRIAFEHENYFHSGLFQEVSHLLITDCDLRVLVSYANKPTELEGQLEHLFRIIKGSDRSNQISEADSFLFIVESGLQKDCFEWLGHVYKGVQTSFCKFIPSHSVEWSRA
jgi:hypothetical protein